MTDQPSPDLQHGAREAERRYINESIIAKTRLTASDYKGALLEIINSSAFSLSAKYALANIVHTSFDQNAMLAKNENVYVRVLALKLELNYARLAMTKPDVLNPMLVNIERTILDHFKDYVSPSYMGGERASQHRDFKTFEGIPQQPQGIPSNVPQQPQQPIQQQNRGIRLPWMR